MEEKIKGYLGLATKAGKLVTGYNTCLDLIPTGKIKLVILATDVGENTRSKIEGKCKSYGIPFRIGLDAETMSRACGKEDKGVFGFTDKGFSASIIKIIDKDTKEFEILSEREVF